jgi:hypothetical protein
MSTQHTPGPWSVLPEECDKPYIRIRGTRLGGRYKIANVVTPVYEGASSQEAEETRANARLIAAAPDLLKTLEELSLYVSHNGDEWVRNKARDALAKVYKD